MTDEELEALEQRVAALEAQVAAQTTDLSGSYTLGFSGEDDDESIGKVLALNYSASDINKAIGQIKNDSNFWTWGPGFTSELLSRCSELLMQDVGAGTVKDGAKRAYPLIMKWGKSTFTRTTDSGNATYWNTITFNNVIPSTIAPGYVVMVSSDWGGQDFTEQHLRHSISGTDLAITSQIKVDRDDQKNKSYTITVNYLIVGKSSSGGGIING